MADSNFVEKPLLEKIQDLLERKPGTCDVAFCVGKEKKIVRTLKIILKASSPFLEKEFEEKWEVAVMKEGNGIPLPEFDPIAFELFVKLTSLDTWSLDILNALNLPPNLTLNLLSICRRFEVKKAVENLETLATSFRQSFAEYKDTHDFLQLSPTNLKSVLGSDDIGIQELDVFHAAIRWAEFQCNEMKMQPTEEHIRQVLGDCFFEIRFPLMTCAEFTEARESKDILTAGESLGIYGYIGLAGSKKLEFDVKKLPFKTTQRKRAQTLESKLNSETNNNKALISPGILTLCLTRGLEIVKNPPFVCDGSQKVNYFASEKKIRVYGLGFFGPIEKDGFYDVKVQLQGIGVTYNSGMLEKRIFAKKDQTFYFVFDTPINLEAGTFSRDFTKRYMIVYYLKGANTFACKSPMYADLILQEGDTKFGKIPAGI